MIQNVTGEIQVHENDRTSKRLTFHGKELKIEAGIFPPTLAEVNINNMTVLVGPFIDLIDTLANEFNFTYKLTVNNNYGVMNDDGQWTGMVGNVSKNLSFLCLDVAINTRRPSRKG